ncbi:nuclear pore complex subunit nup85 [Diplodia corticola]|uniref:Nuclear pore complex protein Nup85 n=1 Tax=Diplodia corticola TaxID=236234 RepID=A0A1J9S3Y9_9PEZI|nr:nuclear pore complex subunit nup85 [Diplodia corticola]OJD34349.1 nuclear pore complex subunit nup85 [Diplodia corticola]
MERDSGSQSPFGVRSLNHDQKLPQHRHVKSNETCIDPLDKDPKRRCNCLNHRHRYRRPSPVRIKYEAPSAISRMYGRKKDEEGFWREDGWHYTPSTPAGGRRLSSGTLPSTTPAGRPLWSNRSVRSTTPNGPPPSSRQLFGSSRQQRGTPSRNTPSPNYRFGRPSPSPSQQKGRTMSAFAFSSRGRGRSYIPTRSQSARSYYSDAPSDVPSDALASSPPPGTDPFYDDRGYFDQDHYRDHRYYDENEEERMDDDYKQGYGLPEAEEMDEDQEAQEDEDDTMIDNFGTKPASRKSSRPASPQKFSVKGSARGSPSNRSRASTMRSPVRPPPLGKSGAQYDIGSIAKSFAAAAAARPVTHLQEPDELVRETERVLYTLGEGDATEETLSAAVKDLCNLWHHPHKPVPDGIGPADDDSPLAKADFIASLLLPIHHPPAFEPEKQNFSLSRRGQLSAFSQSFARQYATGQTPLPKVLVDWLNARHDPSAAEFEHLQRMAGSYSAAPGFWDVIFSCVMRGSFNDAIHFLREGNFAVADSALEDGYERPGYADIELVNVEKAIAQAIDVLQICPAYTHDDWDVKGMDWGLYRRTVNDALEDLKLFAEGERAFLDDEFGLSAQDDGAYNFSTASRRAESRVPYTVYENLQILYSLLLGNEEEILGAAFDWLEATVCLTAWWDGEDEEQLLRSAKRSKHTRVADVTPGRAYRKRFAYALARVMAEEDPGLSINSNDPVEIALACVMEENMDGLIPILRGWSLTITAAIIEIASAGGWLGQSASRNLLRGFDQSDLMVLSYGQGDKPGYDKDEILQQYAEILFSRPKIQNSEGWELAIQVLGRLDNAEAARNKISELLDRLPLSSAERVDKILSVCNSLGLIEHANMIAERYAASLAENSYNYGSALFYYARAHNSKKIRDVLDLLISLCLIHSTAYPAQSDLDERLKALINTPKQTLSQLARSDLEAAQMLSMYLSGYATLRKFYDLRDEEVNLPEGSKPAHRPLERRRLAAQALIAVVGSAADSIRGGLYDPDIDSAVQVDGLLTLLGESLPFMTHPKRLLSSSDLSTLMRAAEDLQTAPSLVYAQCEEHLQAALAHAHGTGSSNMEPPRSLKKSVSNLTASSYSLMGSSVFQSTEGSGVLVDGESGTLSKDAKRGWDWRRGLSHGAKGKDVCDFLRAKAAQELARAWAEEN